MKRITYTKKDFAWTKWGEKDFSQYVRLVKKELKKAEKKIINIPKKDRTFGNTILGMERADDAFVDGGGQIALLSMVSPHKKIRDAAHVALEKLSDIYNESAYDEDMYRAFCEYKEKKESLKGSEKIMFTDMDDGYKKIGMGLSHTKKTKVKKINKELTRLGIVFSKNIDERSDFITLSKNETGGLLKSFLAGLSKDKKGNYKVSLENPEFIPFLQYADNEEKRKELIDKHLAAPGKENEYILRKIVKLRHKRATLLGYKNHAEYRLVDMMANNPDTVFSFINKVTKKLHPLNKSDLKEISQYKKNETGDENVTYYDMPNAVASKYLRKVKEEKSKLDNTLVREYFPLEHVVKETMRIYEELFSISFKEIKTFPTWHEDVRVYSVHDTKEGLLSYALFDLHPREGKYGHACVSSFMSGRSQKVDGKEMYKPPVSCMVTNFTKPTKETPSLLSFEEVHTFFHEFGHLIHGALTEVPYTSQSGLSVARDFVEMPSQMLEYWTLDETLLKRLSGHYTNTKKKLPRSLAKAIIKNEHIMNGYANMRQFVFALTDMKIHTEGHRKNIVTIFNEVTLSLQGIEMPKGHHWLSSFGHMLGYDATYYGYMWSKVYAADMFTRFRKEGLLNKKTGMEYRKKVLARGSSVDEMTLITDFLGRKPNEKAFLKELGVR